jgi:hypothetical protein
MTRFTSNIAFFSYYWFPGVAAAAKLGEIEPVRVT